MIEATLKDVMHASGAMREVMGIQMGAKAAYHVLKLARLFEQQQLRFQEALTKLLKQHGTKNENNDLFSVQKDNLPAFTIEHNELLARRVTIEWGPVTEEMISGSRISPACIQGLGPFYQPSADTLGTNLH